MTGERRLFALICGLLLLGSVAYLTSVDFVQKLDTDVSSMLPQDMSPQSRALRGLISERQGRGVYVEAVMGAGGESERAAVQSAVMERWSHSPAIESIRFLDGDEMHDAFRLIGERKLALLFPKWLRAKRSAHAALGPSAPSFPEWAAAEAALDLDAFLQSPAAMELARPELLDPLLLSVTALQQMDAASDGGEPGSSTDDAAAGSMLFWAELAASPLSPKTQDALAQLVAETEADIVAMMPDASVRYGGLARLAAASRTRIQADIAKINALSLGAVLLVSIVLVRPVWRLAWALPVVAMAVLGAIAISFAVFETVNVMVLIIGSILIGTSIDYAFHALFAKPESDGFPTRKLLIYACVSTIVGFSILLFSEMELIRQIGVFVASGLACSFLAAQALPRSRGKAATGGALDRLRLPLPIAAILAGLALATAISGAFAFGGYRWSDDIRNLEAPDPRVVTEDLALRARFGVQDSGRALLSMGDSYAAALASQERAAMLADPANEGFIPGRVLANANDFAALTAEASQLGAFFDRLESAMDESGYEQALFSAFFEQARAFAASPSAEDETESALRQLAQALHGPAAAMLGSDGTQFWALTAIKAPAGRIAAALEEESSTMLLSQLSMLNESLNTLRSRLGGFGAIALGAVSLTVLGGFGWRRGGIMLLAPAVAGAVALATAQWVFGSLNIFHLIGCFLGGAIALDYALFSVTAFARGEPMPYSVWLSAATTGASFLALVTSYVPAVRSLGFTVAAIAFATIALLLCSQSVPRLPGFLNTKWRS